MNPRMFETLVQKGILRQNTELELSYRKRDTFGFNKDLRDFFLLHKVGRDSDNTPIFEAINKSTGHKIVARLENILFIEGMPVKKFCKMYQSILYLKEDGSPRTEPRKRGPGRPKKNDTTVYAG